MKEFELPSRLTSLFWYFLKKQKGAFITLMLLFFIWPIGETLIPYLTKLVIDAIHEADKDKSDALSHLILPLSAVTGFFVVNEIFYRTYDWLCAKVYPKFRADIRLTVFDYTKQHSHGYFAENFAGAIANRVGQMAMGMSAIMFDLIERIIPVLVAYIIAFIMLWHIHPSFTFILGVWFVIHTTGMIYFTSKCRFYSQRQTSSLAKLMGKLVDVYANIVTMKLFAREGYERSYLKTYQDDERRKSHITMEYMFVVKLILGFASMIMCLSWWGIAIYAWYLDKITVGDVALVILLLKNLVTLAWIMGLNLLEFFEDIGDCKASLALITQPHEIVDKDDAKEMEVSKGEICFDKVNFGYHKRKYIFKDLSVTIKPGEKVGLVGFSGAGKTTLVNLIFRFYDVKKGAVIIDGQNVKDVTRESLRENITMIPQDTTLFHRTIMENIRYGALQASNEEVIAAAKKAHAHDFIMHLEEGYETIVGERGIKLSGGQRQRIAIARAILKDAPILILDEATSALDSVTEGHIQAGLGYLMKNKTTLIIAHRLATLKDMDRLLVFSDGEIVEQGGHAKLIKAKGFYAKMWQMQVEGCLPEEEK